MAHTHTTHRNGVCRSWSVPKLWELAKDLPVLEMDVRDLEEIDFLLGSQVEKIWGEYDPEVHRSGPASYTMNFLLDDMRRILDADLSFPILLNPEGGVMDGCHRIMKALLMGEKILVQQFVEWPPTS